MKLELGSEISKACWGGEDEGISGWRQGKGKGRKVGVNHSTHGKQENVSDGPEGVYVLKQREPKG